MVLPKEIDQILNLSNMEHEYSSNRLNTVIIHEIINTRFINKLLNELCRYDRIYKIGVEKLTTLILEWWRKHTFTDQKVVLNE